MSFLSKKDLFFEICYIFDENINRRKKDWSNKKLAQTEVNIKYLGFYQLC